MKLSTMREIADGEHGGERQDDCLYLRLPPSDGYQLS